IDAEAEARSDADTKLQEAVDAEAEARKAADELIEKVVVSLKEKLEALSGDTVSWQTSDDYLIALVDSEDNLLLGITKDAKVYIPLGLPDGIIGLRELLTEWIPVIEYMTDEEVKEMFEED
ncbi:MAG: hypothetical protein LUD72_07125, partial [Bacteroidales bacterium]|nr:hypothetical protein [Bacteroidales bacterium]